MSDQDAAGLIFFRYVPVYDRILTVVRKRQVSRNELSHPSSHERSKAQDPGCQSAQQHTLVELLACKLECDPQFIPNSQFSD